MLNVNNVQIVYDNVIEAVRDASLAVGQGKIVTLLGSNGAGKSTILKGISGVLYPEEGEIIGGTITREAFYSAVRQTAMQDAGVAPYQEVGVPQGKIFIINPRAHLPFLLLSALSSLSFLPSPSKSWA